MLRKLVCNVCTALLAAAATAVEARRPMALMVFFDGGRADCLRNANCPNLKSLIDGRWAEGYRCAWSDGAQNLFDARTLSYPNHTSIMCGVTAEKHRVLNNDFVRRSAERHSWPTWLSRLVSAKPGISARCFFSDKNDAFISPDPRVPVTLARKGLETCDAETADAAVAAYSGDNAPDAAMFFMEKVDIAGHYFGYYPSSKEYLEEFEHSDRQLGRVLSAIRSRPTFDKEDWMIVFTTDHGGKYIGHGTDDGHCHTVPLIVVGRRVNHGEIADCPRTVDLVPTLLSHFGLPTRGIGLDGKVLGEAPAFSGSRPLDAELKFHVTFDAPYPSARWMGGDTTGVSSKRAGDIREVGAASWGYADCVRMGVRSPSAAGDMPVSSAYGMIDGRDLPAAVALYGSEKAIAGDRPAFTIAFWMLDEGEVYAEDPIILGNKNLYCFINSGYTNMKAFPGFALFLRSKSDDGSRGVTLRYTMGDGLTCRTLGAFTPERGRWNFYAMSVRSEGRVTLYHGRSDGKLNWIAADYGDALWASGSFLMIGQETTGMYVDAARLGFDEFKLWSRALTSEEIGKVFAVREK